MKKIKQRKRWPFSTLNSQFSMAFSRCTPCPPLLSERRRMHFALCTVLIHRPRKLPFLPRNIDLPVNRLVFAHIFPESLCQLFGLSGRYKNPGYDLFPVSRQEHQEVQDEFARGVHDGGRVGVAACFFSMIDCFLSVMVHLHSDTGVPKMAISQY